MREIIDPEKQSVCKRRLEDLAVSWRQHDKRRNSPYVSVDWK